MDEPSPIRRIIACVDSADFDLEGKLAGSQTGNGTNTNTSNVYRLQNALSNNVCYDDQGRQIIQNVRYYRAAGEGSGFVDKFKNRVSGEATEQQIKDLTWDICQQIVDPHDEIYLFGFGKGAYVVRAVAGIFHHMGIPERDTSEFAELYQYTVDLIKARKDEDSRKGGKVLEYLRAHTRGEANIQLVGVFETTRSLGDKNIHDLSFVSAIRNFRHALALNETKASLSLELPETPTKKKMDGRTFVQAWFLGQHSDLGGGTQHDGLSLYPLQWMLLEAMNHGLVFERGKPIRGASGQKSTLALTFPQFAGDVPQLKGSEKIEWIVPYVNGLEVTMFDLQPVHSEDTVEHANHVIHFAVSSNLYGSSRKISSSKRLLGWTEDGPYGTIIHPSVFCLLDRNPRLWEQSKLKPYKEDIANFQYVGLQDFDANLPPWLEGSELSASGVKAFRILVCGKTGVGKSTLINRVFGVQMTEESNTYDQGNHDINTAFESSSHPGLLIHDSRGWQAGSDQELVLIAKFLRHRAFQKDPAEALHVIWFCIDSDVSRIEEADKRTFETIAQYSHNVPVFVIGTKKDKLIAYRKMELLEKYMQSSNDYQEARRLADQEADKLSEDQFMLLKEQLSQIKNYKADGYCCLSKDDDKGVRNLLSQTIDLIADERVRLFCVAAQVVDVDKKIDSAITESMRLGVHAIRTAMVPLPFSGMIGTPTVSRILCEHVMQCFGFPKALPGAVDEIMSRVVLGNLKGFMAVSLTQFLVVSSATIGLTAGTFGIGALLGGVGCILATPPTARMLLKCAADMILILERSFRYGGKYVSTKQIEDAAQQYVVIMTTTFSGKEKLLQAHVHDEIDKLVPLKNVHIGFKFSKLRTNLEEIIYANRFDRSTHPPEYQQFDPRIKTNAAEIATSANLPELHGQEKEIAELENTQTPTIAELPGDTKRPSELSSPETAASATAGTLPNNTSTPSILKSWTSSTASSVSRTPSGDPDDPSRGDRPPDSSRSMLSKSLRKFSLRKTRTNE